MLDNTYQYDMGHPIVYHLIKELLFQLYPQLWKLVHYDHGLSEKETRFRKVFIIYMS